MPPLPASPKCRHTLPPRAAAGLGTQICSVISLVVRFVGPPGGAPREERFPLFLPGSGVVIGGLLMALLLLFFFLQVLAVQWSILCLNLYVMLLSTLRSFGDSAESFSQMSFHMPRAVSMTFNGDCHTSQLSFPPRPLLFSGVNTG
ncbi:hypothetical protein BKA80DRAFT_328711 [Phyllosticta citrichinensis]